MAAAERLRVAIAETGLAFDRLNPPTSSDKSLPLGGPFVPVQVAPESSASRTHFPRCRRRCLRPIGCAALCPTCRSANPCPARPCHVPLLASALTHSSAAPPCTTESISATITAPRPCERGGRVVTAEWTGGCGRMVEIDHGNGIATRYGHLSSIAVQDGQTVDAGTVLGRIGSSGRAPARTSIMR